MSDSIERPFISNNFDVSRGRDADHVARWAAHVAAGRIGGGVAGDPGHRENLARTEALLGLARRPGG